MFFESNYFNIDGSNNGNNNNNHLFETHIYVCNSIPAYIYTNFITDLITYLQLGIGRSQPGYAIKYSVALSCSRVTFSI